MTEPVHSEEEYVEEEEEATESVEYVEEEEEGTEREEYHEDDGETEPEEHGEQESEAELIEHAGEESDAELIEHSETEPESHGEEAETEPESHGEEAETEPESHGEEAETEPESHGEEAETEPESHGEEAETEPESHGEEAETEPESHEESDSETEPGEFAKKSDLAKEGMIEPEFEEEQYVDVRTLPLKPPQPLVPPPKPVRRPWHPIMWDDSIVGGLSNDQKYTMAQRAEESEAKREYPHKQRIRNLRKLIAEGKVKPDTEMVITFLCNKFAISEDRRNKLEASSS